MPDVVDTSDHFALRAAYRIGQSTQEAAQAAERFGQTVRKLGTDFASVPAKPIEVGDRMFMDGHEFVVTEVDSATYQATLVRADQGIWADPPDPEVRRMEREVLERQEQEALQIMRSAIARQQPVEKDYPCASGCRPSEGDVCGGPRCT